MDYYPSVTGDEAKLMGLLSIKWHEATRPLALPLVESVEKVSPKSSRCI